MSSLLQSPILQALGHALVFSLWQCALLWLLYCLLNIVFTISPAKKYVLGIILEMVGFAWFMATLINLCKLYNDLPQYTISHYYGDLSLLKNYTDFYFSRQFSFLMLNGPRIFPYLSSGYLIVLFVISCRWIWAYSYSRKVRSYRVRKMDYAWQQFVEKMTVNLGISKKVGIHLSEAVDTPLTVGFFKPLILIPFAAVNYLTTDQLEAIIVHEMAHIKRLDYLFNLLLSFVEACLFFNPFMQLIHSQIKRERENCCDDWVLHYGYNVSAYAGALLNIASYQRHSPLLAVKATGCKGVLSKRIRRMIGKKESSVPDYKSQLLAISIICTAFCTQYLFPVGKPSKRLSPSTRSTTFLKPLDQKDNYPLLNPSFVPTEMQETNINVKKITSISRHNNGSPEMSTPHSTVQRYEKQAVQGLPLPSNVTDLPLADAHLDNASQQLQNDVFIVENDYFSPAVSPVFSTDHRNNERGKMRMKEISHSLAHMKAQIQLENILEQVEEINQGVELKKLKNLVLLMAENCNRLHGDRSHLSLTELKIHVKELLINEIRTALGSIDSHRSYLQFSNDPQLMKIEKITEGKRLQRQEMRYEEPYEYSFGESETEQVQTIRKHPIAPKRKTKKELTDPREELMYEDAQLHPALPPRQKVQGKYTIRI